MNRIKVFGAETPSEFMATHMGGTRTELDIDLLEEQIVDISVEFVKNNPDTGMILLECTTFPTFAASIQQHTGLPIIDYISFINFIFDTVVCGRYKEFS